MEAVHIYHDVDEFDVELEPDQFYSVSPPYFAWDERMSGGAYRRMIQRFSRRLVSQLPPPLYAWLGCTAAQVLAEIEQQLSLLVQGLVKDRSDAVHSDGAAPASAVADGDADGDAPADADRGSDSHPAADTPADAVAADAPSDVAAVVPADAPAHDDLKDRLHRSALALSLEQQQRLCIARVLPLKPQVLAT